MLFSYNITDNLISLHSLDARCLCINQSWEQGHLSGKVLHFASFLYWSSIQYQLQDVCTRNPALHCSVRTRKLSRSMKDYYCGIFPFSCAWICKQINSTTIHIFFCFVYCKSTMEAMQKNRKKNSKPTQELFKVGLALWKSSEHFSLSAQICGCKIYIVLLSGNIDHYYIVTVHNDIFCAINCCYWMLQCVCLSYVFCSDSGYSSA